MPLIPKESVIGADASSNPFYRDVVSVVNLDGSAIGTQLVGGTAASTSNPVPVYDGFGAPQIATWTTGSTGGASGLALTSNTQGMDCVAVTIQPVQGVFTGGAVTFEVYDGANWVPIKCARESSYNTDSTYPLAGINSIQGWTIPAAAFPSARARLSSAITGTGTPQLLITTIVSSAPDTSVVTAGLDPASSLPAGVNALGTTLETPMASFIDSTTTAGYVYFLQAQPNTLTSASTGWQVCRMQTSNAQVQWPTATGAAYTNAGTGYAALSYS